MKDEYDFSDAERGRFYRPPMTLAPPTRQAVKGEESFKIIDEVEACVVRGPESWNFLYFALAFSIAIEGTILQMLTPIPLKTPWNLAVYAILAVVTGWLFIFNGWFQNWIFALKRRYESRAR